MLLLVSLLQGVFPGGSVVKNPHAEQETRLGSPGGKEPLEKEMATHFSILVWETPRTEAPDTLKSMRSQTAGHGLEAE